MSRHGPVTTLQQMLQQLSSELPQLPAIAPDGQFGEHTLEGVMVFQRDHGLPVTGIVDRGTWQAMECRCMPSPPLPTGEEPSLILCRLMLSALSGVIPGFTPCGIGTPAFQENLRLIQRLSGLNTTGEVDDETRDHLLRLFRLFCLRSRQMK